MVRGTIITIRTTTDDGRTFHHQILAAGGVARTMHELDRWHLLDLEREQVTTVDEIARTWTTRSLEDLRARKQSLATGSVPASFPAPTFRRTGRSTRIADRIADEYEVRAGAFRRELWISREPVLDRRYMSLRFGVEEPGGTLPAALARVHLELMKLQGFPLLDVTSLPAGEDAQWGSRREVVAITEAPIPRDRLRVPEGFTDTSLALPASEARPTFRVPASPR